MDELLDESMWKMDSFGQIRARTLILMLYETGLRISELLGLDDTDVDLDSCVLKVTGKRDKQRVVPFGEELRDALSAYMALRDESVSGKSPALFLLPDGRRLPYYKARRDVRDNLARVCTLKKRSPHVLRHTFATSMLNHGAGLESVKNCLGMLRLQLRRYTHILLLNN